MLGSLYLTNPGVNKDYRLQIFFKHFERIEIKHNKTKYRDDLILKRNHPW